jgi:hypothetical protein
MMKFQGVWVAIASLCLGSPAALAAMMTFTPSKDNTLFEDPDGALSGGASASIFVGRLGSNGGMLARRGAIAFDLSSIPSNAVVSDVSLTLSLVRGNGGDRSIELHRFTKNWGEGTSNGGPQGAPSTMNDVTWRHTFYNTAMWTNPGGDFDAGVSSAHLAGSSGMVTWTATPTMLADVQGWVNNPVSNFGWIMIGDEVASSTAKEFGSKEGFSGAPSLSVTFSVPEPRVISFAAGALLMGRLRKLR